MHKRPGSIFLPPFICGFSKPQMWKLCPLTKPEQWKWYWPVTLCLVCWRICWINCILSASRFKSFGTIRWVGLSKCPVLVYNDELRFVGSWIPFPDLSRYLFRNDHYKFVNLANIPFTVNVFRALFQPKIDGTSKSVAIKLSPFWL